MMNDLEHNSEEKNDDKFSLYTEKIVVSPRVKYRGIISFFKLIGAAVIFGVVASFVMAFLYPKLMPDMPVDKDIRDPLIFNKDEYPTESTTGVSSEASTDNSQSVVTKPSISEQTEKESASTSGSPENADDIAGLYTAVVDKANKSIVRIDDIGSNVDSALSDTGSATETVGIIIGESEDEFIILTSSQIIGNSKEKIIKISDSTEIKARLISKEQNMGLAVLSMGKDNIPYEERSNMQAAALDNSYIINQGDTFVAAGKLYGQAESVDFGLVTGISAVSGIDNSYEIIETGINATVGDYAFLFNLQGNVIGISRPVEADSRFRATGISDLKSLIECLSADLDINYMGIKGVNVNDAISIRYGLPYGIYIKDVIIDSPAFNAGLQAGDVITAFNGESTLTMQSFNLRLFRCSAGQEVEITVKRPGKDDYRELKFKVVLTTR